MKGFRKFIYENEAEDEFDNYRKHDGKREKKTSWKEESRLKRKDRYKEESDDE